MDWDGCVNLAQSYLENSPLIVLGSGASMPYGLPSMRNLAEAIEADPVVKDDPEFANLCQAIDASGLEAAIDSVQLRPETIEHIRTVTWETINRHDTEFFDTNQLSPPKEFVELLNKVIAPAPNKAVVVTTNYDRLPEYAADGIDATSITGFEGSILRKLEIPSSATKQRRTRCRERTVDIWKVHGSLDWFVDRNDKIISVPMSRKIPEGFYPLVVPPGKEKYSSTHKEPYRSIIAEADKAFIQAGAYLCIGYGFNDEHIQPKLLAQKGYCLHWQREGVCNTGDTFLTELSDVKGDVVDMEAYAQAWVCRTKNTPFIAVKYVTDIIGQNSVKHWEDKLADARKGLGAFFESISVF